MLNIDYEMLYGGYRKRQPELYKALMDYSDRFSVPFPMYCIGTYTVTDIKRCLKQGREYQIDNDKVF